MAIFVAMVLDGLDGRVARLTRTQSAFGAELDSLSDMVSFGVAPALVVYVWALKDFSGMQTVTWLGPWLTTKLGWIAAFIYCACAALRLARFNTTLDVADKRFFQGLPSPAAACLVAGLVWALNEYQIRGQDVNWLAWGLTVFAGLTMVSNLKFYSGKDINLRKSVPFSVVVAIAFGIMARVHGVEHAAGDAVPARRVLRRVGLCDLGLRAGQEADRGARRRRRQPSRRAAVTRAAR